LTLWTYRDKVKEMSKSRTSSFISTFKPTKLAYICIFLILLQTIEIGYYLLNKPFSGQSKITTNPLPTPIPHLEVLAISQAHLKSLGAFTKDTLDSAFVNVKYQGLIKQIDNKGGEREDTGFKYNKNIEIAGDRSSITRYFTESDLNNVHVVKIVRGQEIEIDLNELKVGDNIIVEEETDLLKNLKNSSLKFKIYVQ